MCRYCIVISDTLIGSWIYFSWIYFSYQSFMKNQEGKIEPQKKIHKTVHVFFIKFSSNDFIMFDFIIISARKFTHTVYIQLLYYWTVISIHTILESQFIDNLTLFWTKKILVSTLKRLLVVFCGDIMNKWSTKGNPLTI